MGQNFVAMAYVAAEVQVGRLPEKSRTDAEIQELFTASFSDQPAVAQGRHHEPLDLNWLADQQDYPD